MYSIGQGQDVYICLPQSHSHVYPGTFAITNDARGNVLFFFFFFKVHSMYLVDSFFYYFRRMVSRAVRCSGDAREGRKGEAKR